MLRFELVSNENLVSEPVQAGAYVVGSDGVPLRAEIETQKGQIVCAKRADGPAALAVLWPIPGFGSVLVETSRLMDRDKPYNLAMELARGRLLRISLRREEWGLFDFEGMDALSTEINKSRDLFVESLKANTPDKQSALGNQALALSMVAGEKLSHFHADILLSRRKQMHAFTRNTFGCAVDVTNTADAYRQALRVGFDFAYIPIPWSAIEPVRGQFNWQPFDAWIEWFAQLRIPVRLGPLVSFAPENMPSWLDVGESSYETLRNLLFEHVRRVVERYQEHIAQWNVISGIYAENAYEFNFEQLLELTRVTAALVKQLAPQSQTLIDLTAPWGEYYARNQRTIPPMLYADMVVQSGVAFDGLGVQMVFGRGADGYYVRDMFQISEKLDRIGNLGKPVHVTAVQVPSDASDSQVQAGGFWRKPWDEMVQAQWLKEFYAVALSKPFVESVAYRDLVDRPTAEGQASGGLVRANLKPKPAFKVLKDFRAEIKRAARKPPSARTGSNLPQPG